MTNDSNTLIRKYNIIIFPTNYFYDVFVNFKSLHEHNDMLLRGIVVVYFRIKSSIRLQYNIGTE